MSTKPAYVTEARMATLLARFAKAADAALTVKMNEMEQRLRQELTQYEVSMLDAAEGGGINGVLDAIANGTIKPFVAPVLSVVGETVEASITLPKTTMSEDEAEALLHDLHGFVPGSFEFKPTDSTVYLPGAVYLMGDSPLLKLKHGDLCECVRCMPELREEDEVAHFLRVMAQPESTHDTLLQLRAGLSEAALAKIERMGAL